MIYTTFYKKKNDQLKEPLFFGKPVNIVRYDQQKYYIFEELIVRQLSFFWRPEEVNLLQDKIDFQNLSKREKHIFVSNLKYQTLLDSIQGRSPNVALLPLVSIPELETWVQTWAFFESIHSRSYTHIIRNVFINPSIIFNDIIENKYILKRAIDIAKYYDDLINYNSYYNIFGCGKYKVNNKNIDINLKELKKRLYLCLISINALEAIRFYVSFACSFSFGERAIMEGNAKIIRFIARDEGLHLLGVQNILSIFINNLAENMYDIVHEYQHEGYNIFLKVVKQEKEWAEYLFQYGPIIGLNKDIIVQYIEYITNIRIKVIFPNMPYPFKIIKNPLPWMSNWLSSDNLQTAAQETEISSYLTGQINSDVNTNDLSKIDI